QRRECLGLLPLGVLGTACTDAGAVDQRRSPVLPRAHAEELGKIGRTLAGLGRLVRRPVGSRDRLGPFPGGGEPARHARRRTAVYWGEAMTKPSSGKALVVPKAGPVVLRPSIALALGGGGARGLAHILMLEVFDELGLKPKIIAGTSIGALFAAVYASGLPAGLIRAHAEQILSQRLDIARLLFAARAEPIIKLL